MYNIVVFCGGSGSVELQKGLYNVFGENRFNLKIIINAYDNGKSTGECRRVFNNHILGPSDLRKNHLTRYEIKYSAELDNPGSVHSGLYKLFNARVSGENYREYYYKSKNLLENSFCPDNKREYLSSLLDYFFFDGDNVRETVKNVNFTDFAVSNIFYSACAAMNNNSLTTAGRIMADILDIEDNVRLISDVSLMLQAETESGRILNDEGIIVSWKNPEDKISHAFLTTPEGEKYTPSIDEANPDSREVLSDIENADILIFSSGTQWSSLIPTYMHKGFRECVSSSTAKKYLVMNNVEDGDMYGVSSADICEIVNNYIDLSDVTLVLNDDASDSMKVPPENIAYIHGRLGGKTQKCHDPERLVRCIFEDYFSQALSCSNVMFDFDGTIWNMRGDDLELEAGDENINRLFGVILSGNSYEHLRSTLAVHYRGKNLPVYCDYGNTYFETDSPDEINYLTEQYFVGGDLLTDLTAIDAYRGKITCRGNVIVTIKPLKNRKEELKRINKLLEKYGDRYYACLAGNTSIDIGCKGYNKAAMLRLIIQSRGLNSDDVLYIGNEILKGSEVCIAEMGIKTLNVRDVFECGCYLTIKNYH